MPDEGLLPKGRGARFHIGKVLFLCLTVESGKRPSNGITHQPDGSRHGDLHALLLASGYNGTEKRWICILCTGLALVTRVTDSRCLPCQVTG